MSRWTWVLGAATLSCFQLSCSRQGETTSELTGALPSGVLAQVAGRPISVEMVGAAGEEAARRAIQRELLVALVAEEQPDMMRVAERASFARALLDDLRREAELQGEIRGEEVDELVRMRWVELARPRAVRTVHAATLPRTPEGRSAARELAERVADAVRGVTDPDEFADRARAVAADAVPSARSSEEPWEGPLRGPLQGEVDFRVEALPPVAKDGRTVPVDVLDHGGPPSLVVEYAEAAQGLRAVGEQSPIVETSYGWHVILATEIYPELQPAAEHTKQTVEPEIHSLRARPRREALTRALRASTPVEVSRNALELTRGVWNAR